MKYDNRDLLRIARERAAKAGEAQPRSVADIERLTGFAYLGGPNPATIGKTWSVPVKTWSN